MLAQIAANYSKPNFLTAMSKTIPAKRLGTVEEVAAAAIFLFSPAAGYITGHNLYVVHRCAQVAAGWRSSFCCTAFIRCVDGGNSLAGTPWSVPHHRSFPVFGRDVDWDTLAADPEGTDMNPFEQLSSQEAEALKRE